MSGTAIIAGPTVIFGDESTTTVTDAAQDGADASTFSTASASSIASAFSEPSAFSTSSSILSSTSDGSVIYETREQTVFVTPTGSESSSSAAGSGSGLSTGGIVGVVIGVILVLLFFAGTGFFLLRRRRRRKAAEKLEYEYGQVNGTESADIYPEKDGKGISELHQDPLPHEAREDGALYELEQERAEAREDGALYELEGQRPEMEGSKPGDQTQRNGTQP